MAEPPGEQPAEAPCRRCKRPLKPGAAFCAHCGTPRVAGVARPATASDRRRAFDRAWGDLVAAIWLYALLLASSAAMLIVVRLTGATFGPMVGALALDTVVISIFAYHQRATFAGAFVSPGFRLRGFAAIVAAAPVILVAIVLYARGINHLFGISKDRLDDGHGPLLGLLLDAAWPAFFEELAFRGVIFGLLRRQLPLRDATIVSSFAFAILHLSVPSLVTHLPLGLWFCWLRIRSGSLWPSMTAHFLHNAGVLALEQFGWLV
jgi:membrane protease YdiL (CAAX protease family)